MTVWDVGGQHQVRAPGPAAPRPPGPRAAAGAACCLPPWGRCVCCPKRPVPSALRLARTPHSSPRKHPSQIRPLWRHYFHNTQGLIFVVDSADRERIEEAAGELHRVLAEVGGRGSGPADAGQSCGACLSPPLQLGARCPPTLALPHHLPYAARPRP